MKQSTMSELLQITKGMDDLYSHLLIFLDAKENGEFEFEKFKLFLQTSELLNTPYKMREFLHLISMISINHHREEHFFNRIKAILTELGSKINKDFPNIELFKIFQTNKRVLLILIEAKILSLDSHIARRLCRIDLSQLSLDNVQIAKYFFLEIEPYFSETMKKIIRIDIPDIKQFQKFRKAGENHNPICETIRRDCVADFAGYIRRHDVSFNSRIPPSMFETNLFLLNIEKENGMPTLMQYAAFYGAITIVRYLLDNNIELTSDLWIYGVHGRNVEIFRILQKHNINPPDNSFDGCKVEAIRCGHQDMFDYINHQILGNAQDENDKTYLVDAIEITIFNIFIVKHQKYPIWPMIYLHNYVNMIIYLLLSNYWNYLH